MPDGPITPQPPEGTADQADATTHAASGPLALPAPPADAARYVGTMQRDGRLLLRFIARRSDRFLASDRPPEQARATTGADALFATPDHVLTSPDRLKALVATVDELGWRAAPSNVRSIRLTSAYLGIAIEDGEPPEDIRQEAHSVRKCMVFVSLLAVFLLIVAVAVLAHMEVGRRLLLQLKDLRQQEQEVQKDIATLATAESVPMGILTRQDGKATQVVWMTPAMATTAGLTAERLAQFQEAAPLCGRPLFLGTPGNAGTEGGVALLPELPAGQAGTFQPVLWRDPITQKSTAVCRRFDDTRVRLALVYSGLADWNCRTYQIATVVTLPYAMVNRAAGWLMGQDAAPERDSCGQPTVPLPPEVTRGAWRSHETNVTTTSSVVAGFLLPLLLGCLGGCAYALRRIDNKLSNWTLEPHDGRHAVARVALAAVLGGLVGVVWTSGDTVSLGGFTLSLAAAAFFIGFSVEGVFRVIENLINNVTGTIAHPTTPARPATSPAPGVTK